MQSLERLAGGLPLERALGCSMEGFAEVINEAVVELGQIDRRGEMEERRGSGGEHRLETLTRRAGEDGRQSVLVLVQARPECMEKVGVVGAAGELLYFVQQQERRLFRPL